MLYHAGCDEHINEGIPAYAVAPKLLPWAGNGPSASSING